MKAQHLYPPPAIAQRWSREDWRHHRYVLEAQRDAAVAARGNEKRSPSGFAEAIATEQALAAAVEHASIMASGQPKIGRP